MSSDRETPRRAWENRLCLRTFPFAGRQKNRTIYTPLSSTPAPSSLLRGQQASVLDRSPFPRNPSFF